MSRLRDRNRQIPNGMFFYEPSTKWRSTPWASFNVIVDEVIAHRQGNPFLMQKLGKSTDRRAVENEVDQFTASVCDQMGWTGFTIGGEGTPPIPKPQASQFEISQLAAVGAKVRQLWTGVKTLNDWLESGAPGVAQELADSRAATCVACPKNGIGDFSAWFVKPVAGAIQRQVEKAQERKMATASDDRLGVCDACLCPMRLKVHLPLDFIKAHTDDATIDKLRTAPACWQISELAKA